MEVIGTIQGLNLDNGKYNGNYWDYKGYMEVIGTMQGLNLDNGKYNGNYWDYSGYIMETIGIIVFVWVL